MVAIPNPAIPGFNTTPNFVIPSIPGRPQPPTAINNLLNPVANPTTASNAISFTNQPAASQTIALSLGNVTFQQFEVPDEINHFGGIQKIVVHDFPGGLRSTQVFGAFPPMVIRWQGQFLQDPAIDMYSRITTINQMRVNGTAQKLQIGAFTYMVLVQKFELMMKLQYWIPYVIELIPFEDLTQAGILPATAPSVTQQLQAGTQQLNLILGPNGNAIPPAIPSAGLTNLQNMLNSSVISLANADIPALQTSIQSNIAGLAAYTNNLDNTGTFSVQTTAVLNNLNDTITTTPDLQAIVQTANPNLFEQALTQYGDATAWQPIALQNYLITPFPTGIYSLQIPANAPGS